MEHSHVRFLGNLVLNLWDCGGYVTFFITFCLPIVLENVMTGEFHKQDFFTILFTNVIFTVIGRTNYNNMEEISSSPV